MDISTINCLCVCVHILQFTIPSPPICWVLLLSCWPVLNSSDLFSKHTLGTFRHHHLFNHRSKQVSAVSFPPSRCLPGSGSNHWNLVVGPVPLQEPVRPKHAANVVAAASLADLSSWSEEEDWGAESQTNIGPGEVCVLSICLQTGKCSSQY